MRQKTAATMIQSDWIKLYMQRWQVKPALRYYYVTEIFERIKANITEDGKVVEVGCGPGFLGEHIDGLIGIDIEIGSAATCVADANYLPFDNGSIETFVGIDILHHIDFPGNFLKSASESLKENGRIILVEPWAGVLGYLFYRYVHHEKCFRLKTPFGPAFSHGKSSMDGNAMIPRQCLVENKDVLARHGLKVVKRTFFGSLAYIATGGFQPWSMPIWLIRIFVKIEHFFPQVFMQIGGFRIITVLEKL